MQVELSIKQMLGIINNSKNPAYATAVFDGTVEAYESKFPARGVRFRYKESYGEVTLTDPSEDKVYFSYLPCKYYTSEDLTGDWSWNKSEKHAFPKEAESRENTYVSLQEWEQKHSNNLILE